MNHSPFLFISTIGASITAFIFFRYRGYCPQLKYRFGKTYGAETYELAKVYSIFKKCILFLCHALCNNPSCINVQLVNLITPLLTYF